MNRRSMLKAAAAGIAAACGLKAAKAETITFQHSFEAQITGIAYSEMFNRGVMSVNDARLLETRTFSVEDVKRWYRIPDGTI